MTEIPNDQGAGEANNLPGDEHEAPFVDDVCQCVVCRSDCAGIVACMRVIPTVQEVGR